MINVPYLIKEMSHGRFYTMQFDRSVEDFDGYFDENMVAKLVSYTPPDENDVVKLVFYTKPYDAHNTIVAKDNYWAEDGSATATAREATCHPETSNWKEELYLDLNQTTLPFDIVPSSLDLLS